MTNFIATGPRIRRGCAVLTLVTALSACGGGSTALKPAPSNYSFTLPATFPTGDRFYVGLAGVPLVDHGVVHVRDAHVDGVPDGLKVVGIFAVSIKESDGPGLKGHVLGGADEAGVVKMYPHFVLHPVRDAILVPEKQPLDWYLVAVVEATRKGSFKTTGITIDYQADGTTGSQSYAFIIELTCPGPPATPLPSPIQLPA